MDNQGDMYEALEHVLIDANAEPIELSLEFLVSITNNFSEQIGHGGFGVVHKGDVRNRNVAVKELKQTKQFSDQQFDDELACLRRVRHENIVRLLGYCSDTREEPFYRKGKYVYVTKTRRFLCFEFIPNGSLRDCYPRGSWTTVIQGDEWNSKYKLIVGICQGVRYLHNEARITHLDLKPENILLAEGNVPKVTDFGLSRRFSGAQSRIITETLRGTLGYIAPEYIFRGEISFRADIFSLGIIIREILCGSIDSPTFANWREEVAIMDNQQVSTCIDIVESCLNDDPIQRPTINTIISRLL